MLNFSPFCLQPQLAAHLPAKVQASSDGLLPALGLLFELQIVPSHFWEEEYRGQIKRENSPPLLSGQKKKVSKKLRSNCNEGNMSQDSLIVISRLCFQKHILVCRLSLKLCKQETPACHISSIGKIEAK